jgi:hypothetical protein
MSTSRPNVPHDFGRPFAAIFRERFERHAGRRPEPGELGRTWRASIPVDGRMVDIVAVWATGALLCPFPQKSDHIPPRTHGDGYWKASACAGLGCGHWVPASEDYGCCGLLERGDGQ